MKNTSDPGRTQVMTIWSMRIACYIPKVTNTHSEICNTHCFPITTMVARTRLSVTLYLYIDCIVVSCVVSKYIKVASVAKGLSAVSM